MSELTTEQVLLLNQLMYMNGSEGKNNPMDSVSMHQGQAMQDMGMAVLKMAMDTTETGTEEMLEQLESLDPNLGAMVDIQA